MTAIEYLEQRIAVLKTEQPATPAGRLALAHTIHELNNIVLAFRLDALTAVHEALAERLAELKTEVPQ